MTKLALAIGLPALLLTTSCDTPKRFAYMQDVEFAKKYAVQHDSQVIISPGDRLAIHVGSAYPELVAPFNGGGFDTSRPISSAVSSRLATSVPNSNSPAIIQENRERQTLGYLVSSDGYINFPVLGKIKVAGGTLSQIREILENRIIASKYVSDPRVEIVLANYKIYLLGAIGGQGKSENADRLFSVNSSNNINTNQGPFTRISGLQGGILRISEQERVNILEALSLAGDLPANAQVDRIRVIRREGNGYKTYAMDMRSVEVYKSPAFYLKPNDIVYIEPRYRSTEVVDRAMQLGNYAFSSISSLAAIIALLQISDRK